MKHPFEELKAEYASNLAAAVVTRQAAVSATVDRILPKKGMVLEVAAETGIPAAFILASFEREASCDFRRSPAQGDLWDRVSVHVPVGRGPFPNWKAAALDAYHIDRLDEVGAANWTWERCCFEAESFNGFGYRARGIRSPYVWGGTNLQQLGKYTADGRFDPNHLDNQLGVVAIMKGLIAADSSLDLGAASVEAPSIVPASAPPPGTGGSVEDTNWLQDALNRVMGEDPPLLIDGSYGRKTRAVVRAFQESHGLEVDGLAGPKTLAALRAAMAPE